MNKRQKMILGVMIFVMISMFFYPPMESYKDGKSLGYHSLFIAMYHGEYAVDVVSIFAQWAVVVIVGATAFCLAK